MNTVILKGLSKTSFPLGSLFTPRDLFLRSRVTVKSLHTLLSIRRIKKLALALQTRKTRRLCVNQTYLKYKLPFSNRLKKLRTLFSRRYLTRRRKNFLKKANRFYTKLKRKNKMLTKVNKLNKSTRVNALAVFYNDPGFNFLKPRKTRNRLMWVNFLRIRLAINIQKRSILQKNYIFLVNSSKLIPSNNLKTRFTQFYLNSWFQQKDTLSSTIVAKLFRRFSHN